MYTTITSLLYFLVKVVLIEWAVEACRFVVTVILKDKLPEKIFLTHSNRYLHWTMNGLETATVALLLYFGFHVFFIIAFTFLFTYSIKAIGEYFIAVSA